MERLRSIILHPLTDRAVPGVETALDGNLVFYGEAVREIGALQEQLAAEKIEGGRLRGEVAARDEAFRTAQSQIAFYAETLISREKEFRVLPVTGILHADALDPDERVELAEERPEFYLFERKEASFLYHYFKKRHEHEQLPWDPKKVTLYAPATLAEPPYLWKRVVRGSRDEEVHRKAGWLDLAEMPTEPEQIPLSQSNAAGQRVEARCPGQEERICKLEAELGDILSVWPGVVARCIGLEDGETKLKERLAALEIGVWKAEGRLCTLESQSKHSTT